MEFRILGPLEVLDADRAIEIRGRRKRATLAILLLHHGEVVTGDRLADALWGGHPPATAVQAVRVYVSQIRKALGHELVRTAAGGYSLEVPSDRLDACRFERLATEGFEALAAGDASASAAVLRDALALWRGRALVEFTFEPFAQTEIARLDELHVAAREARIEADLVLGNDATLVGELVGLIADYPFRERLRAQLMVALYRAGRQSDALAAYQHARATFIEELGIEPGPEMRRVESAILRQETSLVLDHRARPPAPVAASIRKTVTVAHVDLGVATGDEPDPEAVAGRLARPLDECIDVVERHGGAVTSRTADTVTAAFGLPYLHEDDALRAVRAVVECRDLLTARYDLRPRAAIVTGEVVTAGAAPLDGVVVGLSVRLAHAGAPGEIVLDELTRQLVSNAVEVTPLAGVSAARLHALNALHPEASPFARRLEAPLIGRRAELGQLRRAFDTVVAMSTPALALVAGPPGIGKSRLMGELAAELRDRARVLVGRCLAYGQGITLWPLREIVRAATGSDGLATLSGVVRHERDGALITECIGAAFGLVDISRPVEETLWAFRRLFESLAAMRPVVLIVEDAHWAEPALLDLLEYIAREASGFPVFIVCVSRPELLETRTTWTQPVIDLGPLRPPEIEILIDSLPDGARLARDARDRVVTLAEGNPLVTEQLVALLAISNIESISSGTPTIRAILAARLDRLGPAERVVAERAAIVGREFTLGAVAHLLPPGLATTAGRHIEALIASRVVEHDQAMLAGGQGFRFQHKLVHDAAYRRLPKALRAELHERFAAWLDQAQGARIAEFDELVGYHLESAVRYHLELGDDNDSARALAARAVAKLGAAARRAFDRTDFGAVDTLLSRAIDLAPPEDPGTVELLSLLGSALGPLGQPARQRDLLDEAIRRARAHGDHRQETRAAIERSWYHATADLHASMREAERVLAYAEDVGDEVCATRAAALISSCQIDLGHGRKAVASAERALRHGRVSGMHREHIRGHWAVASAMLLGPDTVADANERCEELMADAAECLVGTVGPTWFSAILHAMRGEFATARALVDKAGSLLEAIGHRRPLIVTTQAQGRIESLAGEPRRAAQHYRHAIEIAARTGDHGAGESLRVQLAEVLCADGRTTDAQTLLNEVARPRDGAPIVAVVRWHFAHARLLLGQHQPAAAEAHARDAAALLASTDLLDLRGDAALALADVLAAGGHRGESAAARHEAEGFYWRKGNLAAVALAAAGR